MASKSQDVKRWIFSGFSRKADEIVFRKYVEKLGGVVVDRENKYTFLCTHVLVRDFFATEKILAALAAGKWILNYHYVDDSFRHGRWLDERKYEVTLHEEVAKFCRHHRNMAGAGIYSDWTFYVYLQKKDLTRSIRRIIAAGDGGVVADAEVARADAIISEGALVPDVRRRVGRVLPIINFHYLKQTLIMKKDPAVIAPYLLDAVGKTVLPDRSARCGSTPCVILQDDQITETNKRSVGENAATSSKRICSRDNKKCPLTPSKQTRLDRFLNIGSNSSSAAAVSLSSVPPSKSKRGSKRQCPTILLSPESRVGSITSYFIKSEPGCSSSKEIGKRVEDSVEIIEEVHVIDSGKITSKSRNVRDDDDCIITKVEKLSSELQPKKGSYSKDIKILKESQREKLDVKSDVYIIANDASTSNTGPVNSKKQSKGNLMFKQEDGDVMKEETVSCKPGDGSFTVEDKAQEICAEGKESGKSVRQLRYIGGPEESVTVDPDIGNDMETSEDLPDIPETQMDVECNLEPRVKKMPSLTPRTSSSVIDPVANAEKSKGGDPKSDLNENVCSTNKLEVKEVPRVGVILAKSEIAKLPPNMRKFINPEATQIRYSTASMKRTVGKFMESTKVLNRYGISYANHAESKVTQQSETQDSSVDDLTHLMHPSTSFQYSTSVRELTMREIAYYESSTDEDTMNSKMAETEKAIVIMGIQSLELFVTTYNYPPASTFGHLLQKLIFEAPFTLAFTRAIDLSYRILQYFPPLDSKMRKYYVQVLQSAARQEANFFDKLYLPWKFILRPIEALQPHGGYRADDSSASSSCETGVSKKENAMRLLEFVIAILSEDLKQPNYKDSVWEHVTWQVFWGQSQDPREITPPIKQLLRHWMSMLNAPVKLRYCLGKLVSMVMELAWRWERCLLLPISPMPLSLSNLADFLRHRIHECSSEAVLQLMYDLPSPWSRSVLGSIIFQSEARLKDQEISFGDLVEFGVLTENQDYAKSKIPESKNVKVMPISPRKMQQKKVNRRGPKGETKLMQACIKGNVTKVQELLAVPGIDINLADNSGWTPLHEAAIRGHDECIKALLNYDCFNSLDMKNTLHLYLRRANYYSCNLLAQAEDGQTALHDAVNGNYLSTARLLLDHGGEVLLRIANKKNEIPMDLCQSIEMEELVKSYVGKSPSKGSQKCTRFGKSSILSSVLSSSHRFLLNYNDRKKFILAFTNNFLESMGLRFCQYDLMIESYNMFCKNQAQLKIMDTQAPTRGLSISPSLSWQASENSSSSSSIDKSPNESIQLLPSLEFNSKLTDLEMESFDQVYEITLANLKQVRHLTAVVQGGDKEPDIIVALRELVL